MSVKSFQKLDISELPLEKKIKQILEQIICELENYVKTNEEAQIIEKMLHDYDSLSDLADITIEVSAKMKKLKTYKFIVASQNENPDAQSSKAIEYMKLEAQVQKYEAEIRNHIKVIYNNYQFSQLKQIEQQLKLYGDSIQDKLEEREGKQQEFLDQNQVLGETINQLTKEKNELKDKLQEQFIQNEELQKQLMKLEENYCIVFGGQNQVYYSYCEQYFQIQINNKKNIGGQNQQNKAKITNLQRKQSLNHITNESAQNQQPESHIATNQSFKNVQSASCANLNTFYTLLKKQNSESGKVKKENRNSHSSKTRRNSQSKERQKFMNLISVWSKNKTKQLTQSKQSFYDVSRNYDSTSSLNRKYSYQPNQSMQTGKYISNRTIQNHTINQELINAFVKQKLDQTQQVTKSFCQTNNNNNHTGKKVNSQMKLKQQIKQQYSTHRRSNSFANQNIKQMTSKYNQQLQSALNNQNYKFQ